jgi:hypothetical protein
MTLARYTGLSPSRTSKDAKYSVTLNREIRLEYQESRRVRWLLTTEDHPELVEMVNEVKRQLTGLDGGAFYINEFHHVLVPDGEGGPCYYAGSYSKLLVFKEGALALSPSAPSGLEPGELWRGPHVGIPYVLAAGVRDIRYEKAEGRRIETIFLSDEVGAERAARLALRLGQHKGTSGGRIFINEQCEFFTRVDRGDQWEYIYLGHLEEDAWFAAPDGFD